MRLTAYREGMALLKAMSVLVLAGTAQGQLTPELARSAVARFEGILRNFDKKQVVVEIDEKQTLVFRRTKSTKIRPKDLALGVRVQVDARKDAVGDMDAVQICEGKCPGK